MIAVPGIDYIPLLNVFGRFLNPYRGFKKLFKDQLEKDFVHGDVLVTGLNSTSRWRHVQGDFNLGRLERRLTEKKQKAIVHIAAFHHPMDCAKPQDEKNLLKAREEAIHLFDRLCVVALGGGSPIDAAKAICCARGKHGRIARVSRWRPDPVAGDCR